MLARSDLRIRSRGAAPLVGVALAGFLAAGELRAQDQEGTSGDTESSAPVIRAHRIGTGTGIDLDGRLREGAWEQATPITDFTQQEPIEGGQPSERTEVRVLLNDDELYIGAVMHQSPDEILAYQKRRDVGLGTDDRFMWMLDTFLDGRTGYFFEINPAGLMGDGLITGGSGGQGSGNGGVNKSWDGIWEARTVRTAEGWSAEIRIPFRTLNFDPELDEWGINFQRTIRVRNEEILWQGHRRNQGLTRPVHAGRVEGLQGVTQGLGLEAKPYVVTNWRNTPAADDPHDYPSDIGGDLSYNVTPSLRAAVSVNTDFAEVEVDDRRVNLTRFPLRFEEQRDFFLEGSGVFSFAGRNGVSPYFSRRIGLVDGEQIPVNFGARLGGQAGRYELGFLQVGTGSRGALASEQFTVARVKRTVFQQSSVGAIYTRRAADTGDEGVGPPDRHTAGIDVNLFSSSFMGDNNAQLELFAVWNSDPDPGAERSLSELSARGFRLDFPNDIWSGHLSYREFGEHYDPAVGFVTRNGFRRVEPNITWRPRPESVAWIRSLDFSVQFRHLEGIETGITEEQQWNLNLFGLNFESGDRLDVVLQRQFEFLDRSFEVSDGVPIEVGEYTNWELELRGGTASRRKVSLRGELRAGGFWNGDRRVYEADVSFRPTPGFNLSVEYEHNDVDLPQGDFTVNLARVEGGWDVSPWASVTGDLQYDDVSEVIGLFLKARWILQPGNDLFLVFTQNWENEGTRLLDGDFHTLSRGASAKVNYTIRW